MIAVLMMFKDEEDIIGKCIDHWSRLGVTSFIFARTEALINLLK